MLAKAPRIHMKLDEAVALVNFLRTVLHPIAGTKYVVYDDGWSDDTVAKKFNLTIPQVAGARIKTVGNLRPAHTSANTLGQIKDDVTAIMEYMTRIDPYWRDKK